MHFKYLFRLNHSLMNQNIITRSFPLLRSSFHHIPIHVGSPNSSILGTGAWRSLGTAFQGNLEVDGWLGLGTNRVGLDTADT